jgi:MOSC domain-containing protein YiiM
MTLTLELLAVSVGRPAVLGSWQGETVTSAIRKTGVTAGQVFVGATNIEGDSQADPSVHGGNDKAVYAYSADNWPWWKSEAEFAGRTAAFGENLTLRGADEEGVRIGDVFAWGDVRLEVSEPRAPCHKFALFTGRQDLGPLMTASGRTGWYFRVLKTGSAPTRGTLTRTLTDEASPSVREAFMARYHPRTPAAIIDKVLAAPALALSWRAQVIRRRKAGDPL